MVRTIKANCTDCGFLLLLLILLMLLCLWSWLWLLMLLLLLSLAAVPGHGACKRGGGLELMLELQDWKAH